MSNVVLDLHGARAREGVDIDALESFLSHLRAALREYWRAGQGEIPRKGGRPLVREAAASAFRLVEFHTGSGIATLAPTTASDIDGGDLPLDDRRETLAVITLRRLLADVLAETRLPEPVVEALARARRAIGDDGCFGVELTGDRHVPKVVIDEERMKRLQQSEPDSTDASVTVIGRLHMIEADPPSRRVGIRAQDGIDWTCTYPDSLHPVVTKLIERLVRVSGTGRRMTAATGRLRIERLDPIPEPAQDPLFTDAPVPVAQLRADQEIAGPQGLAAFVDDEWTDDEESRRFLEATLGDTQRS
jgi:hypothetical protein